MGGWETSSDPYAAKVRAGYQRLEKYFRLQDAGQAPEAAEYLEGVPGVRLKPTTWEELRALVADGSPQALGQLGRSPAQLRHYWTVRDTVIKRDYASVADYLNAKVFNLPSGGGPDGRLVTPLPPGFGDTRRTAWRDNDFPYYVEQGIAHLNLWSSQPLSPEEVEGEAAARLPPSAETLWFVNPPVLQSVPAIWHAHIFWRAGADGRGDGRADGGVPGVQQHEQQQQQAEDGQRQ